MEELTDNTAEELEFIQNVLKTSNEEGLVVEVVYSALQSMKANPTLSACDAMYHGFNEWVK